MSFDVVEHMGDLPMDRYHLSREIGSRRYELRKLSYLEKIIKLATKRKKSLKEKEELELCIEEIGIDIDHLNTTRQMPDTLSSGSNAEIIARLVGADILTDFPSVKDGDYGGQKCSYLYNLIGGKKGGDREIELHIEYTRPRESYEGEGAPVTTVADFKFSLNKIKARRNELNNQINKLWDPYIRASRTEKNK